MLRRILTKAGYEVIVAESGEEALRILVDDACFDLVFTDVRMPGMSGPELASRMARRDPPAIVFMSGASDTTPETLLRLGRGFIKKPFRVAEVVDLLRSCLPAA